MRTLGIADNNGRNQQRGSVNDPVNIQVSGYIPVECQFQMRNRA